MRGPAALAFAMTLTASRSGYAWPVELQAGYAKKGFTSSWRGDAGFGNELRLGARFGGILGVDFVGWEALASVDRRLNTGLTLGLTGYLPLGRAEPFARVFAIHQHEEALVSVEAAPLGVLFGIGPGVRHRAGGGVRLGTEVFLDHTHERRARWVVVPSATAIGFPDALGPSWYLGVEVGVGVDFRL